MWLHLPYLRMEGLIVPSDASADVTRILSHLQQGDPNAAEQLLPIVYDELRALAGHAFASQRGGHTLQPTLLADEVFMKLVQKPDMSWEGRAHFFAVAAKAMRDLLVDYTRAKNARKRGGGWNRITLSGLSGNEVERPEDTVDLIALEEALSELGTLDPRQAQIVELRFFAGLTVEEVACLLGVSERTVLYDWRMARAWLRARLEDEDG